MSRLEIKNSVGIKLFIIAVLSLLLLIPALMIEEIVYERNNRKDNAQNEVSDKWGTNQTISGPILSIPFNKYVKDSDGNIVKSINYAHFLPDVLNIESNLESEKRYRGIYELVVYNAKIKIIGQFTSPDFTDINVITSEINWKDAILTFGISDMKGIKKLVDISINDENISANPGIETNDVLISGISVKPFLDSLPQNLNFSIDLDLNGSKELHFTPVGKETIVTLNSDWNNPSFNGNFLPLKREINDNGFTAEWNILHLNRNYPQKWIGSQFKIDSSNFGVNLRVTVDEYQKTIRTTKYAIMFISLTFLTFFMIELLGGKSVHPIQYLLIGFGLLIFYALLLSLSEHLSFENSYIIASIGIITLISLYTKSVFKENKFTFLLAGILVLLYGYLYIVLQLQDYALIMGSIGLFFILALLMFLTRNIDWFSVMRKNDTFE